MEAETQAPGPVWTEAEVQNRLAAFLIQKPGIVVPNCGAFGWEADLIRLTPSWIASEYEVKVTRADFLADKRKTSKHEILSGRRATQKPRPNFFWYVTPPGLLDVFDIPSHAGLIEVSGRRDRFAVKLRAPRIHSEPMPGRIAAYVMRGVSVRYWESRLTRADYYG